MLCYLPFSQWFCDQQKKWRTAGLKVMSRKALRNQSLAYAWRGREGGRKEGLQSGSLHHSECLAARLRRFPVEATHKCFLHWGGELPLTTSAPKLQQASSKRCSRGKRGWGGGLGGCTWIMASETELLSEATLRPLKPTCHCPLM